MYAHTQTGYVIIATLLGIMGLFAFLLLVVPMPLPAVFIMLVVLFILASFSTLTVTVDRMALRVRFGYGIFSRRFLLKDIRAAKPVKNYWYYGWGIRVWFWPYMWIFNVSGFDAVELSMKNERRYRIGTDDTRGLMRAIRHATH